MFYKQVNEFVPGVDIEEVDRISRAREKWGPRFLKRVFTDNELEYCTGKKNCPVHLAGRY
ncbi:MAG: holo-ACP synthase, partial [Vulcanimicrobiota bacterium]